MARIGLSIWLYNQTTGYWKFVRIAGEASEEWLWRFQRDAEPGEVYCLAKRRPTVEPETVMLRKVVR